MGSVSLLKEMYSLIRRAEGHCPQQVEPGVMLRQQKSGLWPQNWRLAESGECHLQTRLFNVNKLFFAEYAHYHFWGDRSSFMEGTHSFDKCTDINHWAVQCVNLNEEGQVLDEATVECTPGLFSEAGYPAARCQVEWTDPSQPELAENPATIHFEASPCGIFIESNKGTSWGPMGKLGMKCDNARDWEKAQWIDSIDPMSFVYGAALIVGGAVLFTLARKCASSPSVRMCFGWAPKKDETKTA